MCSQDVVATATALADEQAPADREPADDDAAPERESKSRVYDYLSILKDEVVAAGPQRGKRKVTCLCKIHMANGVCGVYWAVTGTRSARPKGCQGRCDLALSSRRDRVRGKMRDGVYGRLGPNGIPTGTRQAGVAGIGAAPLGMNPALNP